MFCRCKTATSEKQTNVPDRITLSPLIHIYIHMVFGQHAFVISFCFSFWLKLAILFWLAVSKSNLKQ